MSTLLTIIILIVVPLLSALAMMRAKGELSLPEPEPRFKFNYESAWIMINKDQDSEYHFDISKYPVTQALWVSVMGSNPSHFKGDDLPVENVSWDSVQEFLRTLAKKLGHDNYRLPTEAEWKIAAYGGKNVANYRYIKAKGSNYAFQSRNQSYTYAGSNNIDEVAWYKGNSDGKTHPVGQKKPNEFGIFDMSGNVEEWTDTRRGFNRVVCGGSWQNEPIKCSKNSDTEYPIVKRGPFIGFRLARTIYL